MQIDMAEQDVSCSAKVKRRKHKAPECERKQEESFSRALMSDQCVSVNPSLIPRCRCKDAKLITRLFRNRLILH